MTDDDKKRFASAMYGLYKAFNREPDPAVTKVLFAALGHLDITGAEYCISQAILKEPRFPIPKELVKYQHEIPRKSLPRVEYKAEYNKKMSDHAMKLINGIMDGKLSKDAIIEGMEAMEKQYPGYGWQDNAVGLIKYYSN